MNEFFMYTKRELISFILNAYIIARQLKNIKIICKIMGYINRQTNSIKDLLVLKQITWLVYVHA